MRNRKVITGGAVVLVIAILALALGACGMTMANQNGIGSSLYQNAVQAKDSISALEDAVATLTELDEKLTLRLEAAQTDTEAAAAAVDAATAALESGEFGDTDLDALGSELYNIQEEASAAYEAYEQVYYAEALTAVETADGSVAKIHKTIGQAIEADAALQQAAGALASADYTVLAAATDYEFPEDVAVAVQVAALNDGVTAAQADIEAIQPGIQQNLATANALLATSRLTALQTIVFVVQERAADILVIGAVLLAVSLVMLFRSGWVEKQWKLKVFRHSVYLVAVVTLAALALRYATGETWELMRQGVFDTLYMTIPATLLAYVLGLPLGVLLVITAADHIRPNASVNAVLGTVINFLRSIPFVILLVMLFDVTRVVMGTAIGTRAMIFPLFVSAFPYVARVVEGSLNEVDRGVIEAAESMGSTTWQIIRKVLLPEALPSLINGAAITTTTILAYTAMAGAAGGDGLGKIAITYGLNYRNYEIMYIASLLLVALVQIIQLAGDILTRAFDHRKK